jgi:hypothetical protein
MKILKEEVMQQIEQQIWEQTKDQVEYPAWIQCLNHVRNKLFEQVWEKSMNQIKYNISNRSRL